MRGPSLMLVLLLVGAGCTGPVGGPAPTDTPTPTATPTGTPTPTMTPPSKPTPNTTTDVTVTLVNRDSRTYHVFVAVVREPFAGATVTYADGSQESFPDVETVRQLRRANNDSRVTDIAFDGATAATTLVTAAAGTNASTTLPDAPSDATLIYFLYTEPFDPTRSTTDSIVCREGTLGPVRFTVEAGSQRFEPGCLQGTPAS